MKSRLEFHLILFLIALITVLLIRWGSRPALPLSAKSPTHQYRPGTAASRSGEPGETQPDYSQMD